MGVKIAIPGLLLLSRSGKYYHLGKRRTERMEIWRFTGLKDEVRMGGFVADVVAD